MTPQGGRYGSYAFCPVDGVSGLRPDGGVRAGVWPQKWSCEYLRRGVLNAGCSRSDAMRRDDALDHVIMCHMSSEGQS